MAKYKSFFLTLVEALNGVDTLEAKSFIGDSINNNRVLTVNQVIRFFTNASSNKSRTIGHNLDSVYDLLRVDITSNRGNNRTDAIDINEFLAFYETSVLADGNFRGALGRHLTI